MICRHSPGDRNCSAQFPRPTYQEPIITPDSKKYEILDAISINNNLVLKVKYPNCKNCSFEGIKIMVFLNVKEIDALKWKEIDPHFTDKVKTFNEAPSPAARFPGTDNGWQDALNYAKSKNI